MVGVAVPTSTRATTRWPMAAHERTLPAISELRGISPIWAIRRPEVLAHAAPSAAARGFASQAAAPRPVACHFAGGHVAQPRRSIQSPRERAMHPPARSRGSSDGGPDTRRSMPSHRLGHYRLNSKALSAGYRVRLGSSAAESGWRDTRPSRCGSSRRCKQMVREVPGAADVRQPSRPCGA